MPFTHIRPNLLIKLLLQMITVYFENDDLVFECNGTIDSAALARWINSPNPRLIYSENWDGVTTPNLKQTTIGLVSRELFNRQIVGPGDTT